MKNKKQRWRLIYLVPMALGIHVKNQIKAKNPTVIAGVSAVCVLLLALIILPFVTGGRDGSPSEAFPSPSAPVMASPTPTATPTPTPQPVSLTLSFAGDCTFGLDETFGYSGSFNEMYDNQGAGYFLQNVRDIFAADDLTVVNFEGTLTQSQERADKTYAFKGDAEYVDVLTSASVEAANIANNHTSDYGEQGLEDTKNALTEAGIDWFGFEDTKIVDINGVKVGFTGQYTVYEDDAHFTQLEENIKALQDAGAQLIVANFHWGLELDYYPEADQVALAHAAIDAGAHLVIGHHPHVLQGIELYKGRYIVYSLGNFCFGGNSSPNDYDCMIFQQTFTLTGDTVNTDDNINVIPCRCSSTTSYNDYCPTPAEGDVKASILDTIWTLSEPLDGEPQKVYEILMGVEGADSESSLME